MSPLEHKKRVIAGAHNHGDFLDFLGEIINAVSDIRTPITPVDSFEVRAGMTQYIQATIDSIRLIRKNELERQGDPIDES